jgi:hypothetical protein
LGSDIDLTSQYLVQNVGEVRELLEETLTMYKENAMQESKFFFLLD